MTFDEVTRLIQQFDESSLSELKYEHDETRLTLKKNNETNPVYTQPIMVHPQAMSVGGTPTVAVSAGAPGEGGLSVAAGAPAAPGTPATPGSPNAAPGAAPASGGSDATDAGGEVITSPIVGTFYRSPSPDSPAFCQEGDVVEKGNTICILEAMKVMNELEAEFTMEIVAFKVNNGDMVEYGTPLVEVRRV